VDSLFLCLMIHCKSELFFGESQDRTPSKTLLWKGRNWFLIGLELHSESVNPVSKVQIRWILSCEYQMNSTVLACCCGYNDTKLDITQDKQMLRKKPAQTLASSHWTASYSSPRWGKYEPLKIDVSRFRNNIRKNQERAVMMSICFSNTHKMTQVWTIKSSWDEMMGSLLTWKIAVTSVSLLTWNLEMGQ
jgi:hypothetical protein